MNIEWAHLAELLTKIGATILTVGFMVALPGFMLLIAIDNYTVVTVGLTVMGIGFFVFVSACLVDLWTS